MRPFGRNLLVLIGLTATMTLTAGVATAGRTEPRPFADDATTAEIGSTETPLGDFVADAIRSAASADIAFIAASSFAGDARVPRSVTADSVTKALEYKDDPLVIVNLTGSQITRAFEHGLYLYPKANSGFLQFSGLIVSVNPDGDKDKKVVSIRVDGSPLNANKTYRVAMPAPLANGALAYFRIWTKDNIDQASAGRLAQITLQTAIENYARDHKTLTKGDDRLVKGR